jgi:hypothetical protein
MNFKDKRARRICAASASAAVIVAGGVVAASFANASGALALTTGNAFTTLDLATGTVSQQTLQASVAMSTGTDAVTLTYGGNSTAGLTAASTASAIQTALNGLASITSAGGVTVTRTAGTDLTSTTTAYRITFNNPALRTAITVTPATGTVAVNSSTAGNTLGTDVGMTQALSNATYATKVTGTLAGNLKLTLDTYTAPSGVTVSGTPSLVYAQQTSGAATGPASGWTALSGPGTNSATSGNLTAANDTFLSANKPGTYTFHFADDQNTVGTGDDTVSPTVTMTVLDAQNATSGAVSDDWSPTVTASPVNSTYGGSITATVPLSGLTLVDTRSSNNGVGILGTKIATLVGVKFTSVTGGLNTDLVNGSAPDYTAPGAVTADATSATRTLPAGVTNTAGAVVSTATFDRNGDGTLTDATLGSAASTNVASNGVTAYATDLEATAVTGTVAAGTNASTLKTGTATATYSVKVTDAGTKTDDVVTFTLTPGTNTPGLTGTGTLVSSASGVKQYAVTADSDGVASITVTSDKTTNGSTYTVGATTNHVDATSLTATYADASAKTVKVTSSAGDLAPASGGTANLKGQLLDQFGAAYQPAGADPRQVSVFLGSSASVLGGANTNTSTALTQLSLNSDGTVSYAYTPTTPATAGTQTAFTFAYDKNANGQYNTGEPGQDGNISWASSTAVDKVAVTAPTSTSTTPLDIASASAAPSTVVKTVTGSVTDSGNAGLAYKTITLTGSAGVLFATDNTGAGLVDTIQVTSNGTGAFTSYAVFTKPGAATITATSEGKSVSLDEVVHAADWSDAYNVTINNVAGMPNTTTVVSGKVTDAFGNPVPGAGVTLTPDDVTTGVLGNAGLTNANGDYSATFTSGATSGTVKVTASITAGTLAGTWASVGKLTLPAKAVDIANGTITIAPDAVAVAGPKSRIGAGNVTLTGTTRPGAAVDIYKKTSAGLTLVDGVTANGAGKFSSVVPVSANTVFLAKTSTATSPSITVHVTSTVKMSSKILRGGVLRVSVSGGPSKSGTIRLTITHGTKTSSVKVTVRGGAASWQLKPGKGYTTVKATYQASGSDMSAALSTRFKL